MKYTVLDELYIKEIREILIRTGSSNLKPEHAIFRLLSGHFSDWKSILQMREEIISDAQA